MHDIFIHSMNLLISYSTIYNVRSFKVYINMYWFASFDSPSLSTPLFVLFGLRSWASHLLWPADCNDDIQPVIIIKFSTAAVQLRPTLAPIVNVPQLKFCQTFLWFDMVKATSCRIFLLWVIMDVKFQKSIRFFVPLIGNLHCRALLRDPEAISVAVAG